MPYAERDELRLYYERDGSGPELVFVPGSCCDQTFYAPQFEYFKRTHSVTALALRGCGRSDYPEGRYDIPTLADESRGSAPKSVSKPVVIGQASAA